MMVMLGMPIFSPIEMPSAIWGTRNIGASSVLDSGEYYAFGEPYTKTAHGFRNYLQMMDNLFFKKMRGRNKKALRDHSKSFFILTRFNAI